MSTAPGFFQSEAVRALLARANRAAGVPIAIHFLMDRHEGPRITSQGACAACKHLSTLSGGKAACRKSRSAVSTNALRQQRPIADTCHLGFGILTLPALPGEGYTLTLGPFVPAGDDAALAHDALHGLADLTGELLSKFPVSLDDIHRAPAGSIPAIAEWITDELARLWADYPKDTQEPPPPPLPEPTPAKSAARAPIPNALALATAIAGTHRKRVRALLADHHAELPPRARTAAQRAPHILTLLTQTLAHCATAGLDTAPAMALLPQAAVALPKVQDTAASIDTAYRLLAPLMRAPKTQLSPTILAYQPLDRTVAQSLPEGLPLETLAQHLQKDPTTITRHLQRRFGLNYSQYQTQHRIENAKKLLRNTQLPATTIGFRVGIDDQSNFTKRFRQHTGLTPLQYRHATADSTKHPKNR